MKTIDLKMPIKGTNKQYYVSVTGNVYSCKTKGQKLKKLVPYRGGAGDRYLKVGLQIKNQKRKRYYVHRLVASHFLRKDCDLLVVNHKDGNPHNNHISNLEWCTQQYNIQHGRLLKQLEKFTLLMMLKYEPSRQPIPQMDSQAVLF